MPLANVLVSSSWNHPRASLPKCFADRLYILLSYIYKSECRKFEMLNIHKYLLKAIAVSILCNESAAIICTIYFFIPFAETCVIVIRLQIILSMVSNNTLIGNPVTFSNV